MPRLTAGVLAIALLATACSVEPIEDPGIGAGTLTTTVLAADGSVIARWHGGEDRVLVSYDELPKHLVDAIVAIEDRRFWIHNGVDVRAVARAAGANLESGEIVQGGSTITMQYIKNTLVGDEVTLERKANEVGLALRLEETLDKAEIFERYANTVFFGESSYGVAAAARRYFDKDVGDLTLADSALLAALINSPTTLNPYLNPDGAAHRREVVLDLMVELGWLDQATANEAAGAPLALRPKGEADATAYPYFVQEVRRRLLENPALGGTVEERRATLDGGGLTIHTTIDPDLQRAAEAAVFSVVPDEGPSGALVALDPRTGHVTALVGGRDYYDSGDPIAQFNLATQGRRQPGSAIKPFALAAALEVGVSIDSTWPGGRSAVIDRPGGGTWEVSNHEDAYYPSLTLHEATVFSVNVPYAHLVDQIGAEVVLEAAAAAGIDSEFLAVPSIVLGTQDVTVLDMAEGYTTFANGGLHVDPVFVSRIENSDGDIVYEHVPTLTRVFSDEVTADVTAALTEAVRRGTGQQAKIGRPIAGKTGTTEGNHDAWFVGYTPELVAAVWVGFAEGNVPMVAPHTEYSITGGTWPTRIWSRFAIAALEGVAYDSVDLTTDTDLVEVQLDTSTGFLAGPLCPRTHVATVHLQPGAVPSVICPIHNPQGVAVRFDGTVPDVEYESLIDGVTLLEASGYEVSFLWMEETDLLPGTIALQSPRPGTTLESGRVVELHVAGPEPGTTMPNVVGHHRADAVERLGAVGAHVTVIALEDPTPDPDIGPFEVWAQVPGPGEPVTGSATVWVAP